MIEFLMPAWIVIGIIVPSVLLVLSVGGGDPRRAERISGLVTAGLGIVVVLVMPFIPHGRIIQARPVPDAPGEREGTTELISLWSLGIEPVHILVLALLIVMLAGVGFGATVGSDTYPLGALASLWALAFLLLATSAVTGFSIGWIIFPLSLCAVVTAIHATRRYLHTRREARSERHESAPEAS